MKKQLSFVLLALLVTGFLRSACETARILPRPDFNTRFFLTFHLTPQNSQVFYDQARLLKQTFPDKVYLKSGISEFFSLPAFWPEKGVESGSDLSDTFMRMRQHLHLCRELNLGLHAGFIFGFVRNVAAYNAAKKHDLRNCQWYSDGMLAAPEQLKDEKSALNTYIWLTLSRYAFDLQEHVKQVCLELGGCLNTLEKEFPETFIAASGDGEVELNFNRMKPGQKDFPVTDYSPFAILEFRDWILHQGLYDDKTGVYAGQGYADGGRVYQGKDGLNQFNLEFDTDFFCWELRYYHFSPDREAETRISWNQVADKTALLPGVGNPGYIARGFDAPRHYAPTTPFWRLWNRFRQEMVRNFTRDIARWVYEGGFQSRRWYSHQIPADYLWGNSPEKNNFEARLVSSASPQWTADIKPWGSPGFTCFDIKFPAGYKRTTENLLPCMQKTGKDWAILEFNPFTIPPQFKLGQEQDTGLISRVYNNALNAGPHLVSIHCWDDSTGEHKTVNTPKMSVLAKLWQQQTDLPWKTALPALYFPPAVKGLEIMQKDGCLQLSWQKTIWYGRQEQWQQIPLFKGFEVCQQKAGHPASCVTRTDNFYTEIPLPDAECIYFVRAGFANKNRSIEWETVAWPVNSNPHFVQQRVRVNSKIKYGNVRISAPAESSWRVVTDAESAITVEPGTGKGPGLVRWHLDPASGPGNRLQPIQKLKLLTQDGQILDTCVFVIDSVKAGGAEDSGSK